MDTPTGHDMADDMAAFGVANRDRLVDLAQREANFGVLA